jgi:hypothetical protein
MEGMEAMWRGAKGDTGAQGDKGSKGEKGTKGDKGAPLSPALRKAIAYMLLLAIALSGANLYWTSHEVNASHAAQVRVQAIQRRQGEILERRICADVGTMARITPPAGPAATNPSRAYEQAENRAWSGLVVALGCK